MGLGGIGSVAYGCRCVAGVGFEVSLSLGLQPMDQNVALSYCSSSMLTFCPRAVLSFIRVALVIVFLHSNITVTKTVINNFTHLQATITTGMG